MNDKDFKSGLTNLVDRIRSATGLSQKEISKKAGYTSENTIAQAISRKEGHEPVIRRLKSLFPEAINESNDVEYFKKRRNPKKEEPGVDGDKAMEALYNLTESNRILAESHKVLAETNSKLADKVITANAPQQTPEVFSTMYAGLQEFLLDVASGKSFLSRQEAAAALMNKFVPEDVKKKAARSIPNN